MKRLPYIDKHVISILADRDATWRGLLRVVCRDPNNPETAPTGFVLEEAIPTLRLALKGRHPFSIYRLVFELRYVSPNRTEVSAASWAAFPVLHGTLYRALVIGTGSHTVVVRLMLRRIAAAARREAVGVDVGRA